MNKKYSNFLTIILILIIVAIIAIIGFLGFKYYQTYTSKSEAEDFVDVWGEEHKNNNKPNKNEDSVIFFILDTDILVNKKILGIEKNENNFLL